MSSDLTDFFKNKIQEEKKEKIDWEQEKQEWLNTIEKFYAQIREWLDEPVKNNYLEIDLGITHLNEMHIGSYNAPRLIIKAGKDSVSLNPIGCLILGASGRIDMTSYKGTYILLVLKDKSWVVFDRHTKGSYEILNEELFAELLKAMF